MSEKKIKRVVDLDTCKECNGFCCKYSLRVVELDKVKPDAVGFNKHEDFFNAKSVDRKIIGNNLIYVLPQLCPHVTDKGCDLGEDKPDICKEFPPYKDDDWYHFCPLAKKLY